MREFLSRGKREDNGEWVYGYLVVANDSINKGKHYIVDCTSDISYGDNGNRVRIGCFKEIIPETAGQYTGFPDKNGMKIFEGDIIVCKKYIGGNWIDYDCEIGYVEMKHGAFGLHRKQGYYRPFKDWLEDYEYEVIGNIHDNPELLEGGEWNEHNITEKSADVTPVVHGKWERIGEIAYQCSVCKNISINHGKHNYCYECGAKMDGEQE